MSDRYLPPEPLNDDHTVDSFQCRSDEQTAWIRRYARQSAGAGTTRVFVVAERGSPNVVAYYAWCMSQIGVSAASTRLTKGGGRYPQPVALLARLGVDRRHEGKGLGAVLLKDVIVRLSALSPEIGCRGLLVHTESPSARAFYTHLIPEFEPSPTDPMHLVLLMKDIAKTLRQRRAGPA